MSQTHVTIPLRQLQRSKDNVRKTDRHAEIQALAASIDAHGLLQNLTVRPIAVSGSRKQHYEVVAGGRRLAALKLLAKRKRIAKNFRVPCSVLTDKQAGLEVSLAENVLRVPLHPADQFDAFAELHAQGLGAAAIAARFGVTSSFVEQRLKLAAVSPRLMAAYRENSMTLDQLTAFTISDDHAAQEHVWFEAPLFDRSAAAIRRALTRTLVEGSDRRARFVGIEAYESAGGTVIRDLFDADAAYFANSQLLDRLAAEKLEAAAEVTRREGWSWVEVRPELDYEELASFGRVRPKQEKLPKKQQKRLEALSERYDALVTELEDQPDSAAVAELDRVSDRLQRLTAKREQWSDRDKSRAGAIVSIGADGTLQITSGLVREAEGQRLRKKAAQPFEQSTSKSTGNGYTAALLRDLSAHRTAALRAELAGQPDVALSALVHALILRTFFAPGHETCINIRPVQLDLSPLAEELGQSPAAKAMAERHKRWVEQLPEAGSVWSWVVEQSREARLELLAYLTACAIDAVHRQDSGASERLAQGGLLAEALSLDMSRWWQPTRSSYLARVSKQHIIQAVTEAGSPQAAQSIARMKKDAMVARAEGLLGPSKWLPLPLRTRPNGAGKEMVDASAHN
jgi:ParB family chromosome partitioning protein